MTLAPSVVSGFSRTGSKVTDVVLSAHRRVGAALTTTHVIGRRRKSSGGDRIDRRHEPFLRIGEDFLPLVIGGEQAHDALRALEGKVRRFGECPTPPAISVEPLLRA